MPYYDKNKFANLPKKPVKTFQDLEVYQRALETSVAVSGIAATFGRQEPKTKKNKKSSLAKAPENNINWETCAREMIFKNMLPCALGLPHLIAEAHSWRFGNQKECLVLLEKVMLNCNKMVVYLEQVRDICDTSVEHEQFEELIKKYLYNRRKVLNLQRSWQKYMNMPVGEKFIK